MVYGAAAPQYRSPPIYGVVATGGQVKTMQDPVPTGPAVMLCNGVAAQRNGNLPTTYSQVQPLYIV